MQHFGEPCNSRTIFDFFMWSWNSRGQQLQLKLFITTSTLVKELYPAIYYNKIICFAIYCDGRILWKMIPKLVFVWISFQNLSIFFLCNRVLLSKSYFWSKLKIQQNINPNKLFSFWFITQLNTPLGRF